MIGGRTELVLIEPQQALTGDSDNELPGISRRGQNSSL
jgi:hypothetical protein